MERCRLMQALMKYEYRSPIQETNGLLHWDWREPRRFGHRNIIIIIVIAIIIITGNCRPSCAELKFKIFYFDRKRRKCPSARSAWAANSRTISMEWPTGTLGASSVRFDDLLGAKKQPRYRSGGAQRVPGS